MCSGGEAEQFVLKLGEVGAWAEADAAGLFIRLWARKEACVKAAAGTLMQGMHLPAAGGSPLRVARPGGPLPGPFLVTDLPVPDGYHAAVAVNGDEPYDVLCRWWPTQWASWRIGTSR